MNECSLKDDYDFYACDKCGRLITLLDERESRRTGVLCPCGSRKYRPTNMSWYHWFLPRVWHFAYLRVRGIA
ncbi:MAG: hypothetical protein EHM23_27685 [Acidobacteria bacterium]|nr:MAG: hypothetical protein EHM23_27685 [Acidobacteriota bacterium]